MLLLDMLNKYLDREDIKQKNIAKKCSISEGTLSSFINHRFDEPRIETVIKISRNLFPEYEKELVGEYIRSFELPKNLRLSMEYLEFNKNYDLLKEVIKRHEDLNVNNKENIDWVKMYKIIVEHRDDPIILSDTLETMVFDTVEMEALRRIMIIKGRFISGDFYHFLSLTMDQIDSFINKSKIEMMKRYLKVRVNEYYGWVYIRLYKFEEARKCFNDTINKTINKKRLSGAYHGLGLTYMFQDYDESLNYLELAKKHAVSINDTFFIDDSSRSINFLNCFWGKYEKFEEINNELPGDLYEEAIRLKVEGRIEDSKKLMNSIRYDKNNLSETAFHYYYFGIIYEEVNYFYKSVLYFRKNNDIFGLRFPCIELLRRNISQIQVESILGEELKGGEINENLIENFSSISYSS